MIVRIAIAAAVLAAASPACAEELFAGAYKHEAKLPWSLAQTGEKGVDVQLGYRGDELVLKLEPYAFVSLNSENDTNMFGVGLSRKIPVGDFYLRPGIGLVVHNGPVGTQDKTDLGSRVLFEPELAVGIDIDRNFGAEFSWVHTSQAKLFSSYNPGLDMLGVRLVWKQ